RLTLNRPAAATTGASARPPGRRACPPARRKRRSPCRGGYFQQQGRRLSSRSRPRQAQGQPQQVLRRPEGHDPRGARQLIGWRRCGRLPHLAGPAAQPSPFMSLIGKCITQETKSGGKIEVSVNLRKVT